VLSHFIFDTILDEIFSGWKRGMSIFSRGFGDDNFWQSNIIDSPIIPDWRERVNTTLMTVTTDVRKDALALGRNKSRASSRLSTAFFKRRNRVVDDQWLATDPCIPASHSLIVRDAIFSCKKRSGYWAYVYVQSYVTVDVNGNVIATMDGFIIVVNISLLPICWRRSNFIEIALINCLYYKWQNSNLFTCKVYKLEADNFRNNWFVYRQVVVNKL